MKFLHEINFCAEHLCEYIHAYGRCTIGKDKRQNNLPMR